MKITNVMICVFLCVSLHCSKDKVNDPQKLDTTAMITVLSGMDQTGTGGQTLADPIVVRVTDSSGIPLNDILVIFSIVEGEGRIEDSASIHSGDQGNAQVEWIIGSSYNGLEIGISDLLYEADLCYVYATGENPRDLNETKTLNSVIKVEENLYEMTFYGDYSGIVNQVNQRYINYYGGQSSKPVMNDYQCSVFTTLGDPDNRLFGRSFDNPSGWRCMTVICRFNPPDGHASLVPTRTRELGYDPGVDLTALPLSERRGLLEAPFYSPDGVNEHGLVVALADIQSRYFTPDPTKQWIYKTQLIREILDHARNVDEAVDVARKYNCYDYGLNTFSTHALVAGPSGQSAVIELCDGEMRAIPNSDSWQVATNSPLYNVILSQALGQCSRYRYIYDRLSALNGFMTWQQGMEILLHVGNPYTQWSIVYDMTNPKISLALDFDFSTFYHFEFETGDDNLTY